MKSEMTMIAFSEDEDCKHLPLNVFLNLFLRGNL